MVDIFFNPNSLMGQGVWALLALSLLTAPMGCFVVWRKLSYFGATLAHSGLLGAIVGLLTGFGVLSGVISFTMLLALGLSYWLNYRQLSGDTVLGMIAHLTLAIGVIAISLMDNLRIDLMAYLFGDVLSISTRLFHIMIGLSIVGAGLIGYLWRGFVNLSIQSDIAKVEGYATRQLEIAFILLLSLTISLGMLSIGVLLIVAMLIIPAATARLFSHSLLQMVVLTWAVSVVCIISGMFFAYYLNFPAGPTVVVTAGVLFIIANLSGLLAAKCINIS